MARFGIHFRMTKFDIKNYLEKIYKVPVAEVRTVNKLSKSWSKLWSLFVIEIELSYINVQRSQGNLIGESTELLSIDYRFEPHSPQVVSLVRVLSVRFNQITNVGLDPHGKTYGGPNQ